MKKTKFAVLFTALIAMLGLSSCLGDPDPFVTNTQIMKVANGYPPYVVFEDAFGTKLVPSNQEVFSTGIDSKFSIVQYKYDTRTADAASKEISAEILGYATIASIGPGYEGVENNAPMLENTYGDAQYSFFDKNSLFLSLAYYYKEGSGNEAQSDLKKHHFYLKEGEPKEGEVGNENTLYLDLIHNVGDPENNKDRSKIWSEVRYFDLSSVLYSFGKTPETIKIRYKVLKYGSEEQELVDATNPIEIKYKQLFPDTPQQ